MKPLVNKLLIVSVVAFTALLISDYIRAEFQYRNNVAALKQSAEKLRQGMSTEQVIAIMGKSSATINIGYVDSGLSVWNWKAAIPPRWLWRKLNPYRCENPYEVIAFWDGNGLGFVMMENN